MSWFDPRTWLGGFVSLTLPLPLELRPATTAAVIIVLLWFFVARRGLQWTVRSLTWTLSLLLESTAAILLLPEYRLTTARRSRGIEPPPWVAVTNRILGGTITGASALYSRYRHPTSSKATRSFPLLPAVVLVVLVAAPGYIAQRLPASSSVASKINSAYGRWTDYEYWARGKQKPVKPVPFRPSATVGANGTVVVNLGLARAEHRITIVRGLQRKGAPERGKLVVVKLNNRGSYRIAPSAGVRRYFARGSVISCLDGKTIIPLRIA